MAAETKTLKDLRQLLCDEIDNLREGKTTPQNVNAITNTVGKIISSVRLELEYAKAVGKNPNIGFIGLIEEAQPVPQ